MSKFNFNPEFYRRIFSECPATIKIPSLSQTVKEATERFYEEFDYYPDIGVFAPGVFTIMGDHLEYNDGLLLQAASPFVTVIVGKSLNTVKCKVVTTSKHVEGHKKAVFPIEYLINKDVDAYPPWAVYLQGILMNFPCKNIKGFDALIHSSIPPNPGYGSSAALQVAFYTFLEATCGENFCSNNELKGRICRQAELEQQCPCTVLGVWDNLTSSVVEGSTGALINCNTCEISTFDMKEVDILFLLTYPNIQIELNDRNVIPRREMELHLIATLLGLRHIREATGQHLKLFEDLEEPSRETVIEILRGYGVEEDCIFEYVDDLFYFPKSPSVEDIVGEETDTKAKMESDEKFSGESVHDKGDEGEGAVEGTTEQRRAMICLPPCLEYERIVRWHRRPPPKPISYIHQRLAELCTGKLGTELPIKECEEPNCLGGLDNLSATSDSTVIGKLLRRLRHIISEKARCTELPNIILRGDYVEFGSKLIQSHLSLKLDYEVSCPTLDSLVQFVVEDECVYGSKMTSGGGTLTLLHRRGVEDLIKKVVEKFGDNFQFYLVYPSSGARILNIAVKSNPKSALSNKYPNITELLKSVVDKFDHTYKYKPTHGGFSPVVLNLIGDHSDYNYGFTVSMAVSLLTIVVGAYNGTSKVRVATTSDVGLERKKVIFPLRASEELLPGKVKWVKLIRGVINHFQGSLAGFDCFIETNIPSESGIPNQTALAMAFYSFLEELTGQKTKDLCKKAYLCMYAIQDFTNTTCGAGEATIAIRAREDYALLMDCRSMTTTILPFQDSSVNLLLTFTHEKPIDIRSLLFSRMEDCYSIARKLGAKTLRCLTLKALDGASKKLSEPALRRAKHIILENERALRSAEALKNNDFEALGELMVASHNSLRYNYEVTTPELDYLVERAMEVDGVLGSKMQCTGNSSCTLTLVKRWAVDDLIEYLKNNFTESLDFFIVTPHNSCGPINVKEYVDSLPGPQFAFEDIFPF